MRSIAKKTQLLLLLVLSFFSAASPAEIEQDEIRAAIAAVNETLMEALRRGDAGAIASLYTEDGQIFPPFSEGFAGREALRRFWQASIDTGIRHVSLETSELIGHGDTAYEIGKYVVTDKKGHTLGRGHYVVIWKHERAGWRLHRDIMAPTVPWTPHVAPRIMDTPRMAMKPPSIESNRSLWLTTDNSMPSQLAKRFPTQKGFK